MSFLQMSLHGAVMIAVVTILRALTLNQVPKKTFLVLWALALVRLLVPFSLPSRLSVYTLLARQAPAVSDATAVSPPPVLPAAPVTVMPQVTAPSASTVSPWAVVWLVGIEVCALTFAVLYVRCYREFQTSLPVEHDYARRWLAAHPLRRKLVIRQSDRVSSPLTFGVLRPVILMPKSTDWSDEGTLRFVLEHEFVHVQRFDALSKLTLIAAVCVHWFDPLVWVMYVLANRDLELSCDETVVHRFGGARADYARTLIRMMETRSGVAPLCNGFSKNAIEERITAIMKAKKTTIISFVLAAVLITGTAAAFATSAQAEADNGDRATAAYGTNIQPDAELLATGLTYQDSTWFYQGKAVAGMYDDNGGTYTNDAAAGDIYLAIKRGSDGDKPLAGAVLSIADDHGRTLAADGTWDAEGKATVTTGEDGRVTVSGVDSGKLEVRELKAPKGYTAFEGTRSVTVKAEGLDVDQVAAAKPKLTITAESPLRADSADGLTGSLEASLINTPTGTPPSITTGGFMPSTGDMAMYAAAAAAVAGAALIVVALLVKRGGGSHKE